MKQTLEPPRPAIRPGLRPSAARAAAAARLMARPGATRSEGNGSGGNGSGGNGSGGNGSGGNDPAGRGIRAAGGAFGHAAGSAFGHAAGMAAAAGVATAAAIAAPWTRPAPGERPPRPRHLRVVEPRRLSAAQRRRRARALLIAGVGAATAIALVLVYLHVVLAQRQFRLDHVNTMVQQDQGAYQELRLQVAQLDSPEHIISTAEGRLGMVQPTKVSYLAPQPGSDPPSGPGLRTPTGQTAPSGDADWPAIKSQLAGTP